MRIALLSTNPELYSTRRILEAGEARGHDMMEVTSGKDVAKDAQAHSGQVVKHA